MPDWDEDSPRLRQNLTLLLTAIRAQALARGELRLADAQAWHRAMMAGLTPPDKNHGRSFPRHRSAFSR